MQTKLFSILVRSGVTLLLTISFSLSAAFPHQSRSLSFADRVTYQRAIENVYWHYRIWPKERPDPKPSLDAVMSQAQLEKKVTEYLRRSQALENDWQRPITADQLQAEMNRVAQHSKQPEVLRQLFAALGNDPFVIAECLARPELSERLLTNFSAHDQENLDSWSAREAQDQMPKLMGAATTNYVLPAISDQPSACDDSWTATSTTNAPTARLYHTAVWTGSEMIVWGGFPGSGFTNTGARYNPSMDSWTATSTSNAPEGRWWHTAVWTGSEMIVWGGFDGSSGLNTGGRYNPSTDSWTATSTTNAPAGRWFHTAVWTGSEMIVWGAAEDLTGGRYNPATDSWTATSTTNAPEGRENHTAVWTGNEMIVWGGFSLTGFNNYLNTGGKYNPGTDSWTATTLTNAPTARWYHTAVWTGIEMVVWGGEESSSYFNTGGRYNPVTNSWTATTTTDAPTARKYHTAVWTGSEMIVWGGGQISAFNTGGRYNPGTDNWTATSTISAPSSREKHTAVWTDSEMIVWGGYSGSGRPVDKTGGRYCAEAATSVNGSGSIDGQGDQAIFNFHATQSDDRPSGSLSFSDPAAGISIAKARIRTLTFNGNSADLGGNARLGDGTRVTYSVSVTDNSSDGSSDTFSISLSNGYSAGGTLTSGDIVIQ